MAKFAKSHEPIDVVPAADQPETFRVRMTVDLTGPLAQELESAAQRLGRTKTDVVREGLNYVFKAMKARNDGFLVGAWKEDEEGRVQRAREFAIGS
ncbi:hypothetical protein [Bosea sp. ASV33]|uniref:hypothetical protein n=1 Tax=Bosea sp. ASV33 TaxID=2795106 RepID=UPI0018ED41EA|nr:hypothetical protein [Bosea sp. ASV33]